MRRLWPAALAAWVAASMVGAARQEAQGTVRPARAFRFERPVETQGGGPRRLTVDVPLLSGAREDLSDLRFFGPSGEEIPYLLLQPPVPEPVWTRGSVLPIPATEKTSGFEGDFHEVLSVDAIRVTGLPVPLLKRLSLEGSGDREHWTVLLAEATLFDLPSEDLRQLDLTFTPGDYRYLRVTWNDTNSGRVPPPVTVHARQFVPAAPPRLPLTTSVIVEQRPSEPGMSRYRLRLPAARLPIVALALVVENERVMREAIVTEPRLSGLTAVPVELGRATLKRVVRDSLAAEALQIPISRPAETQLDLTVDDGSNPPLQLTSVVAMFEGQPFVYFEGTGAPVVARYGERRLGAPRYDLVAARETIRIETVPDARWGEPRAMTPEEAAPPAGSSVARGATIDASTFGVVRPIPEGEAGLMSLELDAAALAHSTGPSRGFSDVRVVDGSGRQVPYLLERCVAPLVLDAPLGRRSAGDPSQTANRGNVSEYALNLPFADLPAARVVLTTSARVFTRRVTAGIHRPADRRHRDAWFEALTSVDWRHADRAAQAPPLAIPLPPTDATALTVAVEEGDNAPLPITGAKLVLPGYRLRFYRGGSEALRLAYGHPDLEPPRYDIQLLAGDVLGSSASEIRALGEPTRAETTTTVAPRLFWAALGIAVVVLLGLVARLVTKR